MKTQRAMEPVNAQGFFFVHIASENRSSRGDLPLFSDDGTSPKKAYRPVTN